MYWERFTHLFKFISPVLLLLWACNPQNRYLIISEDTTVPRQESADQRYVCLALADARNYPELLSLRTQSDVLAYERQRIGRSDPVEEVLFHLVRDDYLKASELLHQHDGAIPEYLRLLLDADLTYEQSRSSSHAGRLVKLYQSAYDAQPCAISKAIIQLRIRQVRYLR